MSDKLATKEPEKEGWKIQLSWKLGPHMLNVRGNDYAEFKALLKELTDESEMVVAALGTFDFHEPALPAPVQQPLPVAAPASQNPKAGEGAEVGPIIVTKIEHVDGIGKEKIDPQTGKIKPGRPYTKHVVHFASGIKTTTFDGLMADVAAKLIGQAAIIRVEKGQWGYDLLNIRPAA